VKGTVARC